MYFCLLFDSKRKNNTMDKIDNLDKKILSILSQNDRITYKDVEAECNVSR